MNKKQMQELAVMVADILKSNNKEKKEPKSRFSGTACQHIRHDALKVRWSSNPGANKKIAHKLATKYKVKEATAQAQVSRLFMSLGRAVPKGIKDNWISSR